MRETSSIAAPAVRVATGSHVGRVRETNEDRVYADAERGSFAVIDGVGGQAAGEHAAEAALETIRQRLQLQIGTPAERVREAIALANDQIYQQAELHPERRGMACVLTLVLLQNGALTAGHVGDTRLYKMRGGALRKLTHDHSPIGEREDRGELTEAEAMRHPRRNEIYREVGAEPRGPDDEGFIEVVEELFEPDAALLLCSDGLSDALSSAAIADIIQRHAGDPVAVVDHLIDRANDAYGKDNVSVVYIEGTAFAPAARRRGMANAPSGGAGSHAVYGSYNAASSGSSSGSGSASYGASESSPHGLSAVNGTAIVPNAGSFSTSSASPASSASAASSSTASTLSASPASAASLSDAIRTGRAGANPSASSASSASSGSSRRSPSSSASDARSGGNAGSTSATDADLLPDGKPSSELERLYDASRRAERQAGASALGETSERWWMSRVLIFVIGLLLGVGIAVGAAYVMRDTLIPRVQPQAPATIAPRTLTVGNAATSSYATIAQAMAVARPGDTVRVGPGDYHEQVVVTDGVSVVAMPAREAVLRAPRQTLQPWTAVIVTGETYGSRVSGLKIASDAQAPVAIGVHVLGRTTIDDLDVSGTTIAGLELAGGVMTVSGTHVHDNSGPGLVLKGGEARLAHNVFSRNGTAVPPGVDVIVTDAPKATFVGNVIGGDPVQRVRGLAADQIARFRESNIVLAPVPTAPAARPRVGPRRPSSPPAGNR